MPIEEAPKRGKRANKPSVVKQYPITPPKQKRGRKKLHESLSTKEIYKEIEELIADLKASRDGEEKKRIRRALRLRGHFGGLGHRTPRVKPEVPEPGEEA